MISRTAARKRIFISFVFMLVLAFAGGCLQPDIDPGTLATSTSPHAKIDVTLSILMDTTNREQNTAILDQAADLATRNSAIYNIKVRLDGVPQTEMAQKVDVLFAGADLPDMIADAPNPLWMRNGLMTDITDWFNRSSLRSDYMYPNLLAEGMSDGRIYSVPIKADSIFLIYNKDLLRKAGIANTNFTSLTWDQYEQMLERIKQAKLHTSNGQPVSGTTFRISAYETSPFIFSAGGEMFSEDGKQALFDRPKAVLGILKMKSLVANGYTANPESDYVNWIDTFVREEAAFITTGGWSLISFANGGMDLSKLGFSIVPSMKSSTSILAPGLSFSIFRSSANQEAAKELLTALYSPPIYKQWIKLTEGIPVLRSVVDDPMFANNPAKMVLTAQLQNTKPLHADYAPSFWNEYNKLLQNVLFSDVNVPAELKRLQAEIQAEIDGNL
ncbi:extracellular solute-binding protein [Cohnella silvisoli]|uniref:Extracellular solute-binding protein n=1 Tax=Cohnella silvisoli TaxID=2873699 RepID=A0ABV1L129_9BACL|nr:extracellular solute-binding protein [Cohnella silvisoli]MCD9024796.1 extracellular solute-binding protein [Cohnella silvisoli]